MLVKKTKVKKIDRNIVLHFPSCVCILQNKYFLIIKSLKQNFVSGSANVGSVGRWVSGRWVSWSVSKWSVVGVSVVGGFNKTPRVHVHRHLHTFNQRHSISTTVTRTLMAVEQICRNFTKKYRIQWQFAELNNPHISYTSIESYSCDGTMLFHTTASCLVKNFLQQISTKSHLIGCFMSILNVDKLVTKNKAFS